MCHVNASSLRTHIKLIKHFLLSQPFTNVIAMSETWLALVVDDSLVSLEGYTLLPRDRITRGGGVTLYIQKSLLVKHLPSSSTHWTREHSFLDYILCEAMPLNSNSVFNPAAYKPPHASLVTLIFFFHSASTCMITALRLFSVNFMLTSYPPERMRRLSSTLWGELDCIGTVRCNLSYCRITHLTGSMSCRCTWPRSKLF